MPRIAFICWCRNSILNQLENLDSTVVLVCICVCFGGAVTVPALAMDTVFQTQS